MIFRDSHSVALDLAIDPLRGSAALLDARARNEWEDLAQRTGAPPFVRPGWIEAWHSAYGEGELALLCVRRDGELAGVLPLEWTPRKTRSPTNTHSPLFAPVADSPAAERVLAELLVAETRGRVDLCYLDPEAGSSIALDGALRGAGRRVFSKTALRSPYVSVEGEWDDYLKTLSRKFVKDLRRQRRRLAEVGEVTTTIQTAAPGLDAALSDFIALESSSWKAEDGTAIASRAASQAFYRELASWAAERDWLRLLFLRVDGRAIAAEFCLECDGVEYALKCGFDPEYRAFGPGQLLTYDSVERAFAEGQSTYEFLGSDEPYKLSWTNAVRPRVHLYAFPSTLRGRVGHATERRLRPLANRIHGR